MGSSSRGGRLGKAALERKGHAEFDESSYIRFHKNQRAALRVNVFGPASGKSKTLNRSLMVHFTGKKCAEEEQTGHVNSAFRCGGPRNTASGRPRVHHAKPSHDPTAEAG